jgi:hypothetical protein
MTNHSTIAAPGKTHDLEFRCRGAVNDGALAEEILTIKDQAGAHHTAAISGPVGPGLQGS